MTIEETAFDLDILIAEQKIEEAATKLEDSEHLHFEALHMDDQPHQFVFQDHWRGKGAHMDHRWERLVNGKILDAMTSAHMKPGIAKESVTTLAGAKEMLKHPEYWKITNETSQLRMFAEEKKPEPREWLVVEGIVKPGEVGATRYEYGVFAVRDKGVQYFGAQKPFFKEFFLQGKHYTGRWLYRQIERRKPEAAKTAWLWQFGKPLDQSPYVLSRRAVNDNWVPPWKVSCLPPSIRAQIPSKYKYWEHRDIRQRIQIRDALRKALLRKEVKVKLEERLPTVLQHKLWKKRQIIRVGPSAEHWVLRIQVKASEPLLTFVLTHNPLEAEGAIGAIEGRTNSLWLKRGFPKEMIPPGKPGNPTKDTPAWIEGLDKGYSVILEKSSTFMKVQFFLKKLRGLYVFKRSSKTSPYWRMSKSELPEPK